MKKNSTPLLNTVQAQILGVTDSHIHYFAQDLKHPEKKVGVHQQMLPAFQQLVAKAKDFGISIKIASGFRSLDRQLIIWNNKFNGKSVIKDKQGDIVEVNSLSELDICKAILLYSALPGASRHHWGSDIDIYADNLLAKDQALQLEPWEYEPTGPMAKLSTFLQQEAQALGFYFPYDKYRGGVAAEPWHLSYIPVAKTYQQDIDINILINYLNNVDIAGKKTIIANIEAIAEQFIFNTNQIAKSQKPKAKK